MYTVGIIGKKYTQAETFEVTIQIMRLCTVGRRKAEPRSRIRCDCSYVQCSVFFFFFSLKKIILVSIRSPGDLKLKLNKTKTKTKTLLKGIPNLKSKFKRNIQLRKKTCF